MRPRRSTTASLATALALALTAVTIALAGMGFWNVRTVLAADALVERGMVVVGGEPKYLLPDPVRQRLFVSDFSRNSVAVVDVRTGLVVGRMAVPGAPAGLALSDDGHILYVACHTTGCVVALDTGSGAIVAEATGLEHPWDVKPVRGPAGRLLLAVTENQGDRVSFLDRGVVEGEWADVGGSEPAYLAGVSSIATSYYPYQMDVAAGILYVVSYGGKLGGRVQAVDLVTLTRRWKADTGKGAFDVRASQECGCIAVTDLSGQAVHLYDLAGRNPREVRLGADPRAARFREGGELLVALQSMGQVVGIDALEATRAYTVPVGERPGPMAWLSGAAVGRSDDVLAVGNQGDGTVSLLSAGEGVPEFADVPADHRFHSHIRALALRGAVGGYEVDDDEGKIMVFLPDSPLTRAQTAKVLVTALALHTEVVEPARVEFVDVEADGASFPFDYVQEAASLGIVNGLAGEPPRFAPYELVTRLQLVRMAVRAAAAVGSPLPAATAPAPFVDISVDHPDARLIASAYEAGLVGGVPGADGLLRFMPYAPVTRGQAAKVVFGMLGALHMEDLAQ